MGMKRRAAATPQKAHANKHQKVIKPTSPSKEVPAAKKAKKKEDEDLKRKNAQRLALLRKEAAELVEQARRQAEAMELADKKRVREEGVAKKEVEEATSVQKRAAEAALAAKQVAEKAASVAKKLAEDAIIAKRAAEEAALAAEVARKKAEEEEAVAQRQRSEADSMKKDVEDSSAKLNVLSAAEEQAAASRAEEKTATLNKVLDFCSQLGLNAHGENVNAIDTLWQHLVDLGVTANSKIDSVEATATQEDSQACEVDDKATQDTEMAATQEQSQQEESQALTQDTQETTCSQEVDNKSDPVRTEKRDIECKDAASVVQGSKSAASGPPRSAPIVLHFLQGGNFRVEHRIGDSATAEANQQKLMQAVVAKRETLEKKTAEAQKAASAHAAAASRIGELQEAAKIEEDKANEDLSRAQRNASACESEVQRMKRISESFAAISANPADKENTQLACGYAKDLSFFGVAKEVISALPEMFAKKEAKPNTKWCPKDKKLLAGIEEKLAKHSQARASMLDKTQEKLKECADGLAVMVSTREERARELTSFDEEKSAKEAERMTSEIDLSKTVKALSDHETQMTREGFMRFSSSDQSCAICCDDVPVGQGVMLGCGHGWYCKGCITRFVDARLQEGTAGDIPCPSCKSKISEADLLKLIPKELCIKLHARSIEQKQVRSGGVQRACPTPNCSMRKVFEDDTCPRQTCYLCKMESCWICGAQPYHEGSTCEEHAKKERALGQRNDDEALLEWMEATGTKQCPKCKMATSKENLEAQTNQDVECHKMMCRNCGTKFCFKCLAILTDTYTCGCTIDEHGFVDPATGKYVKHLQRKPKAKAKSKNGTWKVLN